MLAKLSCFCCLLQISISLIFYQLFLLSVSVFLPLNIVYAQFFLSLTAAVSVVGSETL